MQSISSLYLLPFGLVDFSVQGLRIAFDILLKILVCMIFKLR